MESKLWGPLYRNLALFAGLGGVAIALISWKALASDDTAPPANEPSEVVEIVAAEARRHGRVTTAVGTVVATRSISLRNEVPGTVARVALMPGTIVEAGALLVQLDVSLERADLAAFEAQARLAAARLARLESLGTDNAVSKMDVETARAESEVALAQVQRVRALIGRKSLRAPFRARVGITDIDVGQYLAEGQLITSLQSVDGRPFLDFRVAQAAAQELRAGSTVGIVTREQAALQATVTAMDSLVDATSRSVMVRARIDAAGQRLLPGSAVTVNLPLSMPREVAAVPPSAVRRGPDGDFVFVIQAGAEGELRAHQRRVVVESLEGDFALVTDGLAPGDRVAAAGSFKLRDALRVTEAGS